MLVPILKIVFLLSSSSLALLSAESGSLEDEAIRKVAKMDIKNLERLRQMYRGSHELASESLYEWMVPDQLKQKNEEEQKHGQTTMDQAEQQGSLDSSKVILHREVQNGASREYLISKQPKLNQGSNYKKQEQQQQDQQAIGVAQSNSISVVNPDGDEKKLVVELNMVKPIESDDNSTKDKTKNSDARQATIFTGLSSNYNPINLGTFATPIMSPNTLASKLMSPPTMPKLATLPSMPLTFPTITAKSAKPPKSSVIGNSGGTVALTNDNVVVVNVLSNNYR